MVGVLPSIVHFYPRPPRGGRRFPWSRASFASKFLSTPSARRATYEDTLITPRVLISIHALREEGDALPALVRIKLGKFLSTPSARRATASASTFPGSWVNFYPRPPRGGRPCHLGGFLCCRRISIHALREEGDASPTLDAAVVFLFLSTPSARRATGAVRQIP